MMDEMSQTVGHNFMVLWKGAFHFPKYSDHFSNLIFHQDDENLEMAIEAPNLLNELS